MCCLGLPLSGYLFFLLCAFRPTYPRTLDLFLSLITSTKKNRIMLMTSFIFGRSQQSCIANLHMESLAQRRGSTIWKPVMVPLYISSPPWNISAEPSHATVYLQVQLHHQPWMPEENQWAPDVKMQVLSTYAKGEFLLASGWTQAMLVRWLTMDSTAYQN